MPMPAPTWRSKALPDLTEDELTAALALTETMYAELNGHAPMNVVAYFATARSDLTIEQARRLLRVEQ